MATQRVDIPKGYLPYEKWELLIQESGGLRSCSSAYSREFLMEFEVINAGWLLDDERGNYYDNYDVDIAKIRNYFARRMRKDGWNVEVSRCWDPGKGEFVCIEAVRPRSYCMEHDPDYRLPDALLEE